MDFAHDSRELRFPRIESEQECLSDLMAEIRGGSGTALQELMNRLWDELVRYAAWEVVDVDLAKDIVQGAFIYVWEHRQSWISVGSPRAYLYRIIQHRIIDHQRHRAVRAEWTKREKTRHRSGPPTPADVLAAKEVQRAFEQALSDLPPRRREAFYLVALRGMCHRDAAETLGISVQTVANHVSSALKTLRAAIKKTSDDGT